MVMVEISFPKGLIGFEDYHDFTLTWEAKRAPFSILEAKDEPLHFILVPICEITPDYAFEATQSEEELLGYQDGDECLLYAIVTLPSDPTGMTANLQGPVVLNLTRQRGIQVIRSDGELRYPVLEGYRKTVALREQGKC